MPETVLVNGNAYSLLKLLGKGKGFGFPFFLTWRRWRTFVDIFITSWLLYGCRFTMNPASFFYYCHVLGK